MKSIKIINVKFADGDRALPSSLKIKCNVTGDMKGFYTPYLIKLVERKYDNNYQLFLDTYVSKGAKNQLSTPSDEEPALDVYKTVLALEYSHLKNRSNTIKSRHRINTIKSIFRRRFPEEDINTIEC